MGFWSMDASSWRVTLDEALSRLLDVGAEQGALGVSFDRATGILGAEIRESVRSALREAIERRGQVVQTTRIATGIQAGQWIRIVGRCFSDEERRPTHLAGIVVDLGRQVLPRSRHDRIVQSLVTARDHATHVEGDMLVRLIDAVLLEAGRHLARSLGSVERH